MVPLERSHKACVTGVGIMLLIAAVTAQQKPVAKAGDGQLHSELSLGGRTASLAVPQDLKATDASYAPLLASEPASGSARVQVGKLDTIGTLKIGSLVLEGPSRPSAPEAGAPTVLPEPVRYNLWLESASAGWSLQAVDSKGVEVGRLALAREPGPSPSRNLIAALLPDDRTSGRLLLKWGPYQAKTDIAFTAPSRRRSAETREPGETVNRRHDEDTSILSRARFLAQRNETAMVLPSGSRIAVSFQRSAGAGDRRQAGQVNHALNVDGPDFARLSTAAPDSVILLTDSPVPRLRTEVPLKFGQTSLPIGNQTAGFPGSYGLWLKKVSSGWRLVFNEQPDAWGSQHDPKHDVGEAALSHAEGQGAQRPFAVALEPGPNGRGRLVIIWGTHEWTADFAVATS